MSDATVRVSLGRINYAVTASVRGHTLPSDEPGELGGGDTGPTPYELLLAGVGSCKAITAKMYADRKGWPLTGVRVDLRHDRPEGRGKPERITAVLTFEGDLTEDQLQRLLEIAEKCPVQKTITGELRLEASRA